MQNQLLQGKNVQLNWISNLRIVAMVGVVFVHASSPLLGGWGNVPQSNWLAANFYNALGRFCVPVFVMITGALLLGKDNDVIHFLKKRLWRILVPFLIWSLIYVAYAYYNEDIVYSGDSWTTVKQILHQLKYGSSYHLWYVYMLIGLYLLIPIINKFIINAPEKEVLYFLAVWLLVMLFSQPYLTRYWPQIDTHYFLGYAGYLILGYYLANKNFTAKWFSQSMASLVAAMVLVIFTGTWLLFKHYNGISTLMYEPLSWPVVILSSAVFLWYRYTSWKTPSVLISALNFAGRYTFGIYLAHALILTLMDAPELFGISLSYKTFNPWVSIPVTVVACYLITLLLIFLLSKIPVFGKYLAG